MKHHIINSRPIRDQNHAEDKHNADEHANRARQTRSRARTNLKRSRRIPPSISSFDFELLQRVGR